MAIEFWIKGNGCHKEMPQFWQCVCNWALTNSPPLYVHSQGMDVFLKFRLYHLIQIDDCLGCIIVVLQIKCETKSGATVIIAVCKLVWNSNACWFLALSNEILSNCFSTTNAHIHVIFDSKFRNFEGEFFGTNIEMKILQCKDSNICPSLNYSNHYKHFLAYFADRY